MEATTATATTTVYCMLPAQARIVYNALLSDAETTVWGDPHSKHMRIALDLEAMSFNFQTLASYFYANVNATAQITCLHSELPADGFPIVYLPLDTAFKKALNSKAATGIRLDYTAMKAAVIGKKNKILATLAMTPETALPAHNVLPVRQAAQMAETSLARAAKGHSVASVCLATDATRKLAAFGQDYDLTLHFGESNLQAVVVEFCELGGLDCGYALLMPTKKQA